MIHLPKLYAYLLKKIYDYLPQAYEYNAIPTN